MIIRLHTSLISLVCGAAISAGAFAAPTVRTVGGAGTYTSAASATSARSGSMRTTAATGGLRPSVSTTATGSTDSAATTTGSVSNGTGSMARTASSPRLSIGKYIGAPKSISTSPTGETDLTARVEKLESDVVDLESNKQDNMSGSDYIEINDDNQILLKLDVLQNNLQDLVDSKAGADGREVVIGNEENGGVDETGIYWWYSGESDRKQLLLSWDKLARNLTEMNTTISNILADVSGKLDKVLDLAEYENAGGKALVVDPTSGEIKPTGEFLDRFYDVSENGKPELKGGALIVTDSGEVQPNGRFVPAEYDVSENGDPDAINKALVVAQNGKVVATGDYVNRIQGATNEGKILKVNADGEVDLADDTGMTKESLGELGVKELAFHDTVSTALIEDDAVERAQMADDIVEIMDWIKWWKENVPGPDDSEGVVPKDADDNVIRPGVGDGTQYVLSMDKYGNAQWFRVVTPENAATIEAESETP